MLERSSRNTNRRIYLDNNATTPVDPRVLNAMLPYFTEKFGNAASRTHSFGWEAEEAVEDARKIIAKELNANSREIIFTSGATEAINLAIKGLCKKYEERGKHIVTQVTEHKAVLDTCKVMERCGWEVTYLPVEKDGRIDPQRISDVVRDDTLLVAVMHANNEIGTINPIREIGRICKTNGVFFLVDAAQSFAKLLINVQEMGIDLLAASAHKIYGPKGAGFLYIRRKNPQVRLKALIDGGGHEHGIRSGTLAVPLIVGMGKATEICIKERDHENERLKTLRDRLTKGILDALPSTRINGSMEHRLPNNINFSFPNVDGESLLMNFSDIACSSGSACTSSSFEPSYVIKALGLREEMARSSIRFGLGRFNTEEEIDYAIEHVVQTVRRLREMVPL